MAVPRSDRLFRNIFSFDEPWLQLDDNFLATSGEFFHSTGDVDVFFAEVDTQFVI